MSDLRDWADNFFYRNSIKYINWWNEYNEEDSKTTGKKPNDKVDLILKCKVVDSKKNKISFIDKDNRNFELVITEKPSLKQGSIIKLRCVTVSVKKGKEIERYIKLTDYSSCLIMPSYSYDYRLFEKATQEKQSPAKSHKT